MTKEELFPKEQFPLRARTTLLHSNGLKQVLEFYYQKPPIALNSKQNRGVYSSFTSHNGTDTFGMASIAKLRWDMGLGGNLSREQDYFELKGDFVEKTEDEMYQMEDEFMERIGVTAEQIIEEGESWLETSSLGWESF